MSIYGHVKECLCDGRLKAWEPAIAGEPTVRQVLLVEELYKELEATHEIITTSYGFERLRVDVERFIRGDFIVIAENPSEDGNMKLLTPQKEEVWTFRMRDQKPSIRLFGRFAYQDVFVATNYDTRDRLGDFGSKNWKKAIALCKARWNKTFVNYGPLSGEMPNAYIRSKVTRACDL